MISVVIYPFLPASSKCCFALNQMSSDCLIRLTSLFQIDWTTSFKLWHLFLMRKNCWWGILTVDVRYLQSKCIRKFEYQTEKCSSYAPAECAVLIRWSSLYSFIAHKFLIIFMLDSNVFAFEISMQPDNSFLVRNFSHFFLSLSLSFSLTPSLSLSLSLFFFFVTACILILIEEHEEG